MFSKTNHPLILWSQNRWALIFDFINVFIDYLNLYKSIWLVVYERVVRSNKIKMCKEIAIYLLQNHNIYNENIKTPTSFKTYIQLVKS